MESLTDYDNIRIALQNARDALEIINKYNRIGNDLQAYLYEIARWGLGYGSKPNPENFGLLE